MNSAAPWPRGGAPAGTRSTTIERLPAVYTPAPNRAREEEMPTVR